MKLQYLEMLILDSYLDYRIRCIYSSECERLVKRRFKKNTPAIGVEMFLIPKTPRSKRYIAIPDFLYDELQEYMARLYECEPDKRIFHFTKHALEKEIKRKAEAADLPVIMVHDLRHSHASLLIEMGFDILEVSERLGHESVQTTWDTYSHLYPDKDQKIAGQLNRLRRSEDT